MINNYHIILSCDPAELKNESDKVRVVTFNIAVLDRYKTDDSKYAINLNNNVGTIEIKGIGSLPIDVNHDLGYVNTFLYTIGYLPDEDQEHFSKYNIIPEELSETANRRWREGKL